MAIDKFIMGLIVFSVFIFSGIFLIGDFNKNYSYDGIEVGTSKLNEINNSIGQIYNVTRDMRLASTAETNPDAVEESMFRKALNVVTLFPLIIDVVGSTITYTAGALGLDAFFAAAALAAIAVFIFTTITLIVLRIRG